MKHYPVISEFPDYWDGVTKTLKFGYDTFAYMGYDEDALVRFQVEMLRRFRPQGILDQKGGA